MKKKVYNYRRYKYLSEALDACDENQWWNVVSINTENGFDTIVVFYIEEEL